MGAPDRHGARPRERLHVLGVPGIEGLATPGQRAPFWTIGIRVWLRHQTRTLELHRRRGGGRRVQRDLRVDDPPTARDPDTFRASARRTSIARSSRQAGHRATGARPGAEARGDPVRVRAAPRRAQGRADRPHDARDGEDEGRGRRRRPGSDRHELLHGRRGTAPLRADDPVRAGTSSRCPSGCRSA